MKRSRLLALALALALVLALSLAVPALAADEAADGLLTRMELVEALYKLSDEWNVEPVQDAFDDVPAEGGEAQIIHWALDHGIVNGYGHRRFGPEDPVTREQMAAMLYRDAQALGRGFQGAWMFPLNYPDAAEVSGWADEAMHWVVMNGILVGTDEGLEPKALSTDDQLSLVLQRWQKTLTDTTEGVWYSIDDVALAMKVPADMEFIADSDNRSSFLGRSDRLAVDIYRWDQVGGPEIEDLAALAADWTGEPTEVVERGELSMVKVNRFDQRINYYLMAPNGDSYFLWITPNTDAHPELTVEDVAAEAKAVEESFRHCLNVPEDSRAVEVLPVEYPELDYMVLVNKTHALPEDWEGKLQTVHTVNSVGDDVEVERLAYKQYLALKADLAAEGIYTELDSARRSVAAQQDIMDRFIEKYGADYAAKTVAQPGYSEHHTGLALDLYFRVKADDGSFSDVYYNEDMEKEEYKGIWETIHSKLAAHGFILRYLEGMEHITGYRYEPWHIRYLASVEDAYAIMSQPGLTLEEFLAGKRAPEAAIDLSGSELYTEAELTDAMLAVKCRFAAWEGCELRAIRYAGDEANSEENLAWLNSLAEGADFVQAAELLMDFHTAPDAAGAWEPDHDYNDYQWWLARSQAGDWEIVSWGYG